MSFIAQSPQPSFAWQFESSNVDYVTGLAPSSSLQPGPGYLQGTAALVANAPTNNTAVSFDGTTGCYMTLGASGPTTFDTNVSNLFVETWFYATSIFAARLYNRAINPSASVSYNFTFRVNNGSLGVANGVTAVNHPTTVVTGTWYHAAMSITTTGLTTVFLNGQAGTPTTITLSYNSTYPTIIGAMASQYMNGYIRDLRVVQGGVVPTTSFTPEAAPFSYNNLPNCVTGSGSTVFTLLSQFFPLYVPGKYNQALYFDNRNAAVSAANSYTTYTLTSGTSNSYSLSCWIKPLNTIPPTINPNYVVLRDSGGYYSLQNFASSSTAGFYANEGVVGGQGTTFSGLLTTGIWDHHCFVLSNVAATSSNTIVTYYFNGTFKAFGNVQRTNGFSTFSALDLGYRGGSPNSGAWCSIDDLRIYNTVLGAAQVQSIYNAQGMPSRGVQVNTIGTNKTTMTNTPLFSQLSAAATSSAVGAFSLRAVNGTTAKAVQIIKYTLLTVPPVALTQNTFTATGTFNGVTNGQYVALCSSYNPTGDAYRCFDQNVGTRGTTPGVEYTVGTGAYIGTASTVDSTSTTYNGGWFQIKIPSAINAISYSLSVHSSLTLTAPYTWKLFGSTTGSSGSWVILDTQTNYVFTTQTVNFPLATMSAGYTYFRLAANKISPSSSAGDLGPTEIVVYGYSSLVSTTQDFYADRLGNLLTVPVTGQTLVNWLGGATGYVVTWYDQSGAGNHATQATAANQPIIQRATKGPGYSCLFNGASSQVLSCDAGTYSLLNGKKYTVYVTERRNNAGTDGTQGGYFGLGNTSGSGKGLITGYWNLQTNMEYSHRGDNLDNTIAAYAGASEPVRYTAFDYSASTTKRVYINSSILPVTNTSYDLSATAGAVTIGKSFGTANTGYYYGEMYEILIFTRSLYDLDGTSTITQIYQNQLAYTGT